jgi:putative oxidoreductase
MRFLQSVHPGYGIAIVRIMAGIVLLTAGYAKWTGPGIAGITGFFGNVGIPAPAVMAPLLMSFEVVGGLLLIVGAFSRIIGAAMIVQFLVAAFVVSFPSQMGWNQARLDLLMGSCGALFLLAGAGLLSVDAWLAGRGNQAEETSSPSYGAELARPTSDVDAPHDRDPLISATDSPLPTPERDRPREPAP